MTISYNWREPQSENVLHQCENGPWLIRMVLIMLNIWTPNSILKKDTITSVPVWVKLHNVPVVAFSEVGLSIIASSLGKPIMLDSYTSTICQKSWGKNSYARVLTEVSSLTALLESVVVAVPFLDGWGHSFETVKVEYEWQPPRCDTCKIFDHIDNDCPKRVKEVVAPDSTNEDGFTKVTRKQGKGKHSSKYRQVVGVKLTKPKPNLQYRPIGTTNTSTATKKTTGESSSSHTSHVDTVQVDACTKSNDLNLSNSFSSLDNDDEEFWTHSSDLNNATLNVINESDTEDVDEELVVECDNMHVTLGASTPINEKPQGNNGILKKLDRVMANVAFSNGFAGNYAIFQPYGISDHSPAVLRIPVLNKYSPKPFKFSNVVTTFPRFNEIIMEGWSTSFHGFYMFNVVKRLKSLKKPLRKLFYEKGNLHDNVNKLRVEVEHIQTDLDADPFNQTLRDEEAVYVRAFTDALIMEERFLKQKAKVEWLKVGDSNSAYFHKSVKGQLNHTIIALVPKMLISPNQSAFVPDRRISDNILLTQELMHNYHLDRGSPRCAFKVDIQKAYDTVDWDFLKQVRGVSGKVIMEAMEEFKNVFGLVPSLPKSTAYFCNVLNHTKLAILQILPFEEGTLPVKYLGVPLVSSRLVFRDCKELIDRLRSRINDWKNKSLSAAGRLQLVRSVLGSVHIYWASVFILPNQIILDIEHLMRGFLWCHGDMSRGKAKVSWEIVCLLKNEGGLGIRRLDTFNKALMVPHIWNLLSRKDSLWVKWINVYKLRGRNFFDIPYRGCMTWGWRKLLQLRPLIRDHFWFRIGNGNTCSLWFDKWSSMQHLASIVSCRDIHRAGFTLFSKVSAAITNGDWSWPDEWFSKYHTLNSIAVPMLSDMEDKSDVVDWYNVVWFPNCIPSHAFHLWLVAKRRLKTQDRLRPWDIIGNTIPMCCPLCDGPPDSHDHLFYDCPFSAQVWNELKVMAGCYIFHLIERRDEKKILDHLKQDLRMLVIKRFRERKKVFRERKLFEKFVQRGVTNVVFEMAKDNGTASNAVLVFVGPSSFECFFTCSFSSMGFYVMNKGFLNSGSKKNGVEELADSNVHESNAKKNVGIHMGQDGKPLHNPKEGPIKSILKRVTTTTAGDNSLKSGFGDSLQHGSVIVEPSTIGNEALKQHGYIADLFKSSQQKSKKIVKVSYITTFEEINGADVAIPKVVVDEVREHFSNTLYGYFIGKRIHFLIVEKYVMNTWAKYGIERAIVRNGFYLFKFKTKEGTEQVMEHGPWTIRLSPLILNIWKPNTKLVKEEVVSIPVWVRLHKVPIVAYSEVGLSYITSKLGKPIMLDSYTCDMCINPWGQSSYARALIEMTSDRAFVKSLVVGIPLDDSSGHSLETIDVEYESKPPHCGVCKVFGHSPSSCPKRPMVDTNNSNKNSLKSDSKSANGVDEEQFIEVYSRKKKGKNRGKSTRIDGVKLTKPKASFYQEKKGTKSTAASTSRSLPGKSSTLVSNSFDNASTVPNDTYDSPKVTKAGDSRVNKTTKVPSTLFPKSARPECINESDTDEDDIVSSYGPSLGGGDQLEDGEFDFSHGYEAQVFDLPGQLKEIRDFRLSISGRK
nr:hypothetical protein [Tanacetum cinerariifolium]